MPYSVDILQVSFKGTNITTSQQAIHCKKNVEKKLQ